jgi:hypothetical protein
MIALLNGKGAIVTGRTRIVDFARHAGAAPADFRTTAVEFFRP